MRGRLALALCAPIFLVLPSAAALEATSAQGVTYTLVAQGLTMPVDVAIDEDGALYYAELQSGALRRIAPGASAPDVEPIWVAPDLQIGVERGFMGLALAGKTAEDGFYVFYTHNASGTITNRLSLVRNTGGTADAADETPILWDLAAEKEHNGGRILPMPDGTILLALGDATLNTEPEERHAHARDPDVLQGKVLRILPDGSPAPGNPFGNRVWTMGHRNVYGLAASPDGVVLATENGRERDDEINILRAGGDYGWPLCAGRCDEPDIVQPILTYTPTIAPTGAAWFRGAFYFADFNDATLHRVRPLADGSWSDERVLTFTGQRMLDVEAGPDGLYIPTWSGIYRVELDAGWTVAAPRAPATPPDAPGPSTAPTPPAIEGPSGEVEDPEGADAVDAVDTSAEIPLGPVALVALLALACGRRRTP